jgi:hypothetical protein
MSPSFVGSGPGSTRERTKRSRRAGTVTPGSAGFQTNPGATSGVIATVRGPVRLSSIAAMDFRHDAAICSRSPSVIVTWTSFSASAKVRGETSGPACVMVPKVGGAPGVDRSCAVPAPLFCSGVRHAAAAPRSASGTWVTNCLRVFMGISCHVERVRRQVNNMGFEGYPFVFSVARRSYFVVVSPS